jgi:hypothetical protein
MSVPQAAAAAELGAAAAAALPALPPKRLFHSAGVIAERQAC